MNVIKDMVYNCRQATFLIEKKQIAALTTREKIQLKVHLTGCAVCKIFQQQSVLINSLLKQTYGNTEMKLDDSFKQLLQRRIEKELA